MVFVSIDGSISLLFLYDMQTRLHIVNDTLLGGGEEGGGGAGSMYLVLEC